MLLKTQLSEWHWDKDKRELTAPLSQFNLNGLPAAVILNTPAAGNVLFENKGMMAGNNNVCKYTPIHTHSSYSDIVMYIT